MTGVAILGGTGLGGTGGLPARVSSLFDLAMADKLPVASVFQQAARVGLGRVRGFSEMLSTMKSVVLGAMGAAGMIALASILDIATGFPFTGQVVMDVLYVIAAGTVVYMGYDAYKDLG